MIHHSEKQPKEEYIEAENIKYAIIWRKKGSKFTDPCPFCNQVHLHAVSNEISDGHRNEHCSDPILLGIDKTMYRCEIITSDGSVLTMKDGYWLKEY